MELWRCFLFCCMSHDTILGGTLFCIARMRSTFIFLTRVVYLFVSEFLLRFWIFSSELDVMLFCGSKLMMTSWSVNCFSNAGILFFNSSIKRLGSPLWLYLSLVDISKVTFSSSSNFLSTACIKVSKISISPLKTFWKGIELWLGTSSVFLGGLFGVSLLSPCKSEVVWMPLFSWVSGMIKLSESNTELSEVWHNGSTWGSSRNIWT